MSLHIGMLIFGVLASAFGLVGYVAGVVWLGLGASRAGARAQRALFILFNCWLISPIPLLFWYISGTTFPEGRSWSLGLTGMILVLYALAASAAFDRLGEYLQERGNRRFRFLRRTLIRGLVLALAMVAITTAFGMLKATAVQLGRAQYRGNDAFVRASNVERDIQEAGYRQEALSCHQFVDVLQGLKTPQLRVHQKHFISLFGSSTVELPGGSQPSPDGAITYFHSSGSRDIPINTHSVSWEPKKGAQCGVNIGGMMEATDRSTLYVSELIEGARREIHDLEGEAQAVHERPGLFLLYALVSTTEAIRSESLVIHPANDFAERLDRLIGWADPILTLFVFALLIQLGGASEEAESPNVSLTSGQAALPTDAKARD
jgi:hypothetical protein